MLSPITSKRMSHLSTAERLPSEILDLIFSSLPGPVQLTNIRAVCKRWKKIVEANKFLWKNALDLDLLNIGAIQKSLVLILKLTGDDAIDHLAVRIENPYENHKMIRRFCNRLPSVNVQNLWLEIQLNSSDKELEEEEKEILATNGFLGDTERDDIWSSCTQANIKAINTLSKSIRRCSNLKSLHINLMAYDHMKEVTLKTWFPHSAPVAKCNLERFTFNGVTDEFLSSNVVLYDMLSQARVIELTSSPVYDLSGSEGVHELDALTLLDVSKESLEECQLDVIVRSDYRGENEENEGLQWLVFPRLFRLFLSFRRPSSERAPLTFRNVSFDLPKLKEVFLECDLVSSLCHDILTKNVETLHIIQSRYGLKIDSKTILYALQNCTKLRNLTLENFNGLDSTLSQLKDSLLHVPLEKIIILSIGPNAAFQGQGLFEFIKARNEQETTKIKAVHIHHSYCRLHPTILDWLAQNIEDFRYKFQYDGYSDSSITEGKECKKSNNTIKFYSRYSSMMLRKNHTKSPMIVGEKSVTRTR